MSKPLPPIVHGPITLFSRVVRVTAVAANATVEVMVDGNIVGDGFSSSGGTAWVSVAGQLAVGQSVTAVQHTGDGSSDPSAQPVMVVDVPNPLPAPVFISPLSTCMSRLRLDGLIPGATVEVRQGNTLVGDTVVSQTSAYVTIRQGVSLQAGARLKARQTLTTGVGAAISSPDVLSLPLPAVDVEQPLPAPGVGQPLIACRTAIDFFGMTPSANVDVDNEGIVTGWLNVATAYNGWGAPPLREGKLIARQRFPRCNAESSETMLEVGPPQPPGQPTILTAPCPKTRRVRLTGLEPGAAVELSMVTPHPTMAGAVEITPIGEATASYREEDFDLPLDLEPVTPQGALVLLTARQTLCGLPSADAPRVGFATPGPAFGVKIVEPVFECALRLSVTGAHPSSLLQPFSADSDAPIGDAVVATGSDMTLALWLPLATDSKVLVRQTGCSVDGNSPTTEAMGLPNELPVPAIVEPVRPQASSVFVRDCVPGARVHLLVNQVLKKSVDVLAADASIPTGDLALADGDKLWAIQTLCTKESSFEGMQTTVAKGNMAVTVSPKSVERGTSAAVTVTAADADTGTPIVGAQVFLNGALVGKTGTAFGFAPTAGQPNPAGLVREPVAHHDASFTIILTDPPPAPQGKLSLNVGPAVLILNTLRLVSASWTVKTMWSPSQTFTSSSANAVITLPPPPQAAPDKRVSVTLETTWEVAGYINGIAFPKQQFPGHMDPNPTFLAWDGTDLTAGWWAQWGIAYDDAGNPWVIVVTKYQGAQ